MKIGTKITMGILGAGALYGIYYIIKNKPFASDDVKAQVIFDKYTKGFAPNQLNEMEARARALVDLGRTKLESIKEVIAEIESGNLPLPVANSTSKVAIANPDDTFLKKVS